MRRFRKYFKFLILPVAVLAVLSYASSSDARESQDIAGISIDPADRGQYWFGLELANADKESGFTVKPKVVSVRAKNLREAIFYAGLQNDYPLRLTHATLVVLHDTILARDMFFVCEMLLSDWQGQTRSFMAVADGCRAIDILNHEKEENLRSTQLNDQIDRTRKAGGVKCEDMLQSASQYIGGQKITLPLIELQTQGYRVSGSVDIQGE